MANETRTLTNVVALNAIRRRGVYNSVDNDVRTFPTWRIFVCLNLSGYFLTHSVVFLLARCLHATPGGDSVCLSTEHEWCLMHHAGNAFVSVVRSAHSTFQMEVRTKNLARIPLDNDGWKKPRSISCRLLFFCLSFCLSSLPFLA